ICEWPCLWCGWAAKAAEWAAIHTDLSICYININRYKKLYDIFGLCIAYILILLYNMPISMYRKKVVPMGYVFHSIQK
ncbi:MAG: hypothetical protein K2P49_07320, partial [Oscillospiraceae bacterium]|nr:hypothetical protein [Oscillospiraceae bacterium]